MVEQQEYKISVGSAVEYEDLIAEITFDNRLGVIISQERRDGDFDISLHSLFDDASGSFDYCKNREGAKIKLSEFEAAISEAKKRLKSLPLR